VSLLLLSAATFIRAQPDFYRWIRRKRLDIILHSLTAAFDAPLYCPMWDWHDVNK